MSISPGPKIKINETLGETYQLIDLREWQTDDEGSHYGRGWPLRDQAPASRLDALPNEIASSARDYLSAYGVALVSVFFTRAELQSSDKSEAEKEAGERA